MSSIINPDEQTRQQAYLNMKASQNALNNIPSGNKQQGRHDRKALFSTLAILAALVIVLILLSSLKFL